MRLMAGRTVTKMTRWRIDELYGYSQLRLMSHRDESRGDRRKG